MLTHRIAVLVVAACAVAPLACQNAAGKQLEAEKVQIKADETKAEAQQQADEAQESAAEALVKEKSEYKDKIQKQLGDEDAKLDDLQKSAAAQRGQAKTSADAVMGDLADREAGLEADIAQIDSVQAAQWAGLKTKIDADIDYFHKTVRTASGQIKAAPPRARAAANQDPAVIDPNTLNPSEP